MLNNIGSEFELLQYLESTEFTSTSEQEIISDAYYSIYQKKGAVTNKAIILLLLEQLEVEDDEVRKDIYRNALEIVVARTSDDF
ncbi:biofilm development regulator YmgB/AriR family protein, partial [Rouxiella badensis]|jgi:hypothetical protein|uniref:biofilm development regulator YmgB/AriR family protein n=1 Tax=Rouxiella badensis TaxID=1646377 RepID=UPI00036DE8FD